MFPKSLNIPLTNPQVLDFIKSGKVETQWNFWQTHDPTEIYKEVEDFCFHDIANLNAICRPGAYDFYLKSYLQNRKLHFEKKQIIHAIPEFPNITENSFGIILYRQQVEEIVMRLTDCSEEFARKVRKGYGKNKKSEITEHAITISKAAIKKGYDNSIINKTLDCFDKKTDYIFDRRYAYYMSLKIYLDAFYQLHYPDFVEIEKEDHTKHLKDLIDVANDFLTFRNDVIEHFGEFYAVQTDMFFERAVRLAEKDLPFNAIQDALFALSLQSYQDNKGISDLLGFLTQLHIDINKFKKAKTFSALGRKMLDPDAADFYEDSKLFDDMDDIIKGEEWKVDEDE